MMMRGLIINADDYAMDSAVDLAILDLAQRGVVTSTSCMVLSPRWPFSSASLREQGLHAGLHLDFTSAFAAAAGCHWPLAELIARAFAGGLDPARLRAGILQQLDRFEEAMDAAPRFVDGHQHVHQLPVVREALVDVLAARYGQRTTVALRTCRARRWRGVKAATVAATGARGLQRLAHRHGMRTNSDFAGVYAFDRDSDLRAHWSAWTRDLEGDLPLVMCHVAAWDGGAEAQTVRRARLREYLWLGSGEFQALRAARGLRPCGWTEAQRA
jgi:predicted glycoside hydrolase/deacetylase ChbG (UPF0249 family)